MNRLRKAVRDYLKMRRGLGFKLVRHEAGLREFVLFLARKRSARITVNIPPPPPLPAEPSIEELFARNIQDAFFDFDKYDVRPDARETLTRDAEFLRRYAQVRVLIEGHCDERGTNEYNIGLGEHRAQAAKQFLVSLGISSDRIQTITYGEERPFCRESNETCWQQNRRAHFVLLK